MSNWAEAIKRYRPPPVQCKRCQEDRMISQDPVTKEWHCDCCSLSWFEPPPKDAAKP